MTLKSIVFAGLGALLSLGLTACSSFHGPKGDDPGMTKSSCHNKKGCSAHKGCPDGESCPMSKAGSMGGLTQEGHEKMAKLHQEAAECLKSGKSQEECRPKMPMMGHKAMMASDGKMGAAGRPMMEKMDECMKQFKGKTMDDSSMKEMMACVHPPANEKK